MRWHVIADWLSTVLRPAQEFFTYMETSSLPLKGLWAGRDLYRATPVVTRDLGFSGLIRRTAPFCRLIWHTRGCGESILARILIGWHVMEPSLLPSWVSFIAWKLYHYNEDLIDSIRIGICSGRSLTTWLKRLGITKDITNYTKLVSWMEWNLKINISVVVSVHKDIHLLHVCVFPNFRVQC
jgi:hypothetical protein